MNPKQSLSVCVPSPLLVFVEKLYPVGAAGTSEASRAQVGRKSGKWQVSPNFHSQRDRVSKIDCGSKVDKPAAKSSSRFQTPASTGGAPEIHKLAIPHTRGHQEN